MASTLASHRLTMTSPEDVLHVDAATTFVYRCRDGDKRLAGMWVKFSPKCMGVGGSRGSYWEGDEVTLEFNRDARTLCISDRNGACEHPLADNLPTDRTLHFCVDTCEFGQGATIVSSGFRTASGAPIEDTPPEPRPSPVHIFSTAPAGCSPINIVTADRLTVTSNSARESSLFGCTLLEPALTTSAQVTFR